MRIEINLIPQLAGENLDNETVFRHHTVPG